MIGKALILLAAVAVLYAPMPAAAPTTRSRSELQKRASTDYTLSLIDGTPALVQAAYNGKGLFMNNVQFGECKQGMADATCSNLKLTIERPSDLYRSNDFYALKVSAPIEHANTNAYLINGGPHTSQFAFGDYMLGAYKPNDAEFAWAFIQLSGDKCFIYNEKGGGQYMGVKNGRLSGLPFDDPAVTLFNCPPADYVRKTEFRNANGNLITLPRLYTIEAGVRYPGNDINNNKGTPFVDCSAQCARLPNCVGFVKLMKYGQGCNLKSEMKKSERKKDRNSVKVGYSGLNFTRPVNSPMVITDNDDISAYSEIAYADIPTGLCDEFCRYADGCDAYKAIATRTTSSCLLYRTVSQTVGRVDNADDQVDNAGGRVDNADDQVDNADDQVDNAGGRVDGQPPAQ